MKTENDLIVELSKTVKEANETLKNLHAAMKDTKTFYKHERDKAEQILREETVAAIAKIAEDVHGYLVGEVDLVVAEFRARLLGEDNGTN